MGEEFHMTRIYNPDGSKLRNDQIELLRMLKIVSEICETNNINWWLSSGTLLGSARHKGFIPWDDDIDIVLLKKDYKRLEKILVNLESDEFVFHCHKTDIDYINTFGKFRKKDGVIHGTGGRYPYYKWKGIGLDIFSIEKTNYLSVRIGFLLYAKLHRLNLHISTNWLRHMMIICTDFLCGFFFFPILRVIGLINPNNEYHYSIGTGWPSHTFYYQDTFPLTRGIFEGVSFPVPNNVDRYLSNVYGNWKTIPSPEEIKESIHCQEYRDEIYGCSE